jgi:DeoR/GlpR family transcriptional regulator of sugar metabolism
MTMMRLQREACPFPLPSPTSLAIPHVEPAQVYQQRTFLVNKWCYIAARVLCYIVRGTFDHAAREVRGMLAVDRRHRLLERVAEEQTIHIAEFAREFGVSEMTIRRDVAVLERDGFIKQTYGGATAHLTRTVELAFNARALLNSPAKRLIGMTAASLLEGVSTFFVGIGSTAEQFARFLPSRDDLTVITESLPVASLLGTRSLKVVVLGGSVRRGELACIGPCATATLARYRADVAVIGAAGLSVKHGLTELHQEEAENHRVMIERSDRVIVLADGSKLDQRAIAEVAPAGVISTLVTDESAPQKQVKALRAAGVNVLVAHRRSSEVTPAVAAGSGRAKETR